MVRGLSFFSFLLLRFFSLARFPLSFSTRVNFAYSQLFTLTCPVCIRYGHIARLHTGTKKRQKRRKNIYLYLCMRTSTCFAFIYLKRGIREIFVDLSLDKNDNKQRLISYHTAHAILRR